ncbi:MAG TPA: fumarylacetoacetate hydrolase family protein [Polyangiales bacterium]|nr:fumarylacetoacetate hydrolase family protein [Polyangiales bacterium]
MTEHTNEPAVERCAALLEEAERARYPIAPPRETFPKLSIADAYRVQLANVARRKRGGERVIGHKVGLTAKAMQELFGVDEPDYGHLFDTMLHDAVRPLDLSALIDPQIEVEPAFVLGRKLEGGSLGVDEVLAATDCIMVCFEVIDSRVVDWRIGIQDTVADNGSSARVVLGSQRVKPRELDLANLETVLELDGQVVERGNTGAVLGHPARSVAWLASTLSRFGLALEPGDIVLPGTCTRCRRIAGRHGARGSMHGLGNVSIEFENSPTITGKQ